MQFVADLHLHSKYSRAVSKDMTLSVMAMYASEKGLQILSAADWTHGLWFKEIRSQLEEAGEGLYKLKSQNVKVKITNQNSKVEDQQKEPLFLLSTEISSIYSQGGRVRRIHNLVFAPNFETAEKINKELVKRGCNLMSDGRPIVGLSSKNLLELILEIDERAMLIPCHVWTPHFGVYGSASGFESLEEAFGDLAKYVYGIETGLSSDPEMNWQIKELQHRSILSFSDAHSPAKMGREATVFELEETSYENIRRAIMRDDRSSIQPLTSSFKNLSSTVHNLPSNRIIYTIEFYPEEGKYHFSGHRNCKVVFGPEDIKAKGNICPVCKRKLTEGVLYRVQQLANKESEVEGKLSPLGIKWYTDKTKNHPPYIKLVPLLEIVAEGVGTSVASQKAKTLFTDLCLAFGSEIEVLLKAPIEKIQSFAGFKVGEGVKKVREGNIGIDPGFDGEYGKVKIWQDESQKLKVKSQNDEKKVEESQMGLF